MSVVQISGCRVRLGLLSMAVIAFVVSNAQQNERLRLWYNQPSGEVWENALPLGNGTLGAMVNGNVPLETIAFNEHTLWSGSPNANSNPLALDSLAEIRRLIFEGRQHEAEQIANRVIISRKSQGQMFLPAGALNLSFQKHDRYTSYTRELDIERAIATTTYQVDGVTYTRTAFASLADRVIIIRLTADQPHRISFTSFFSTPLPGSAVKTTRDHQLNFSGVGIDHEGVKGMVKYKGVVKFAAEHGSFVSTDTSVSVQDADAVTIYVSIATNFNNYENLGGNENARAAGYLAKALSHPYTALLKRHVLAYQHYFGRVKFQLLHEPRPDAPTDERLRNFNSTNDPAFAALYYQFGRYLLISSSQPGSQPANLQGIWNNKLYPPWDSKYTININAEMNYWPAEKTNLSELHGPFLKMVQEMAVTGRATAKSMYGTRGWMAHHNTDIWRATGAVDGAFWGMWVNGGGWGVQHLWEHYQYTGDRKFLSAVYPAMKEAALFYADFLIPHPSRGWLVICPDMSPENAPKAHGGSSLDAGVTMTNQIMFDVFSNTINAAQLLKRDPELIVLLTEKRAKLAPMQIGKHGQLQEWIDDIDDPEDHHRHISHLYGLFPSNQVSPYRTPELYSAARNTLLQRGDVSTGWSMGWKVNWWARMLDGNHAYRLIQNQLSPADSRKAAPTTTSSMPTRPSRSTAILGALPALRKC